MDLLERISRVSRSSPGPTRSGRQRVGDGDEELTSIDSSELQPSSLRARLPFYFSAQLEAPRSHSYTARTPEFFFRRGSMSLRTCAVGFAALALAGATSVNADQTLKTIPVGGEPTFAVSAPDGQHLFVGNAATVDVTVIDTRSDTRSEEHTSELQS